MLIALSLLLPASETETIEVTDVITGQIEMTEDHTTETTEVGGTQGPPGGRIMLNRK